MGLVIKGREICSGRLPMICVPLMGADYEGVMSHLDTILEAAANTKIDIVELRGDFLEALENFEALDALLQEIRLKLKDIILLFTIRSPKEGGQQRSYDRASIYDINKHVIQSGLADMVDVELMSVDEDGNGLVELAKDSGVKIIMSNHDFDATPATEEIVRRLCRMQKLGADVAKIAVMPNSKDDVLRLLDATRQMLESHHETPVVTMSMGSLGAVSRVLGEVFGSAITFGAVGEVSAPGQIPVDKLGGLLEDIHSL